MRWGRGRLMVAVWALAIAACARTESPPEQRRLAPTPAPAAPPARGETETAPPAASDAATRRLTLALARVDALTEGDVAAVAQIERDGADQQGLAALDLRFAQTRQRLMTDVRLAELGRGLAPEARRAVAEHTRARHEALLARLAAAGRRHRAQPPVPGAGRAPRPAAAAP